ncbi:MAG: hypothetical protein QOF44_2215 [Streptomyces sp.]|nr:hypothetical protein [Streptomyces sp.]
MSTCTAASAELGEPIAATAATARTWLLVEQPGPWGAKALRGSHLDPDVGRALEKLAAEADVRVGLIRRPGRHADAHEPQRRRVYVAGASWVRTAVVDDPGELLGWDLTAPAEQGEPYAGEPLAFVCTNGKRDRCCALYGRPLATELAAGGGPGQVWETTHLGGHRFSPTMLVLPYGYAYGRLDPDLAGAVLAAARDGRVVLDGCRGRSAYDRPGQAADLAVRALTGEDRVDALTVEGTRVTHVDGRQWDVDVAQVAAEPPRPESCGAAPVTPVRMEVTGVRAVSRRS